MAHTTKPRRRTTAPTGKGKTPPLPLPELLLNATTTPDVVTVPFRTVVCLDGQGAPEGDAFPRAIMAIYGTAYPLKFARKKRGRGDFKIGPLEARWWTDDPVRRFPDTPRDTWRWQLRIAVPKDVTDRELTQTIGAATQKKGGKLEGNPDVARVRVAGLPATRYGRVLHVGPYATETESFERIVETLKAAGLAPGKAHSEVYLSDPRRIKPEKLRTVLLLELA